MGYVGGKHYQGRRIASQLQPYVDVLGLYYEPFVGNCNIIIHITNSVRVASDAHADQVAMWQALQMGWEPPHAIHRNEYETYKHNTRGLSILDNKKYERGFIGHMSYGGVWWGGYTRMIIYDDEIRWQSPARYRDVMKKLPKIQSVFFMAGDYRQWQPPLPAVVYCDPPYRGTYADGWGGAGADFDHDEFWEWATKMGDAGHVVFVSEFEAPSHFERV